MTDEELILMYRQYKKKRRIIIIIISFLVCLSLIVVYQFPKLNDKKNNDTHTEIKEEVLDKIPPELKLLVDSIEIIQDEDIDYVSYIESAIDDKDGDLKNKVEFNKIDTSIIGEQKIIYYVSDSSNNSVQKEILVNVKAKEIETNNNQLSQNNESKETNHTNENTSKNNSSSNSTNKTNKTDTTNKSQDDFKSNQIIKYFLFSDGYTMANVTDACSSELKKYNRTGMCIPIQDDNGIYLGMKLEIN